MESGISIAIPAFDKNGEGAEFIKFSLNQLEKQIDREFKHSKFKAVERKMEKLRKANEKLRDSGKYWHDACKEAVRDLLGKKKTR